MRVWGAELKGVRDTPRYHPQLASCLVVLTTCAWMADTSSNTMGQGAAERETYTDGRFESSRDGWKAHPRKLAGLNARTDGDGDNVAH